MRLPIDQRLATELVRDIAQGIHGNILGPGLDETDQDVVKILAEGLLTGSPRSPYGLDAAQKFVRTRVQTQLEAMPPEIRFITRFDFTESPALATSVLEQFIATALVREAQEPIDQVRAKKLAINAVTVYKAAIELLKKVKA